MVKEHQTQWTTRMREVVRGRYCEARRNYGSTICPRFLHSIIRGIETISKIKYENTISIESVNEGFDLLLYHNRYFNNLNKRCIYRETLPSMLEKTNVIKKSFK